MSLVGILVLPKLFFILSSQSPIEMWLDAHSLIHCLVLGIQCHVNFYSHFDMRTLGFGTTLSCGIQYNSQLSSGPQHLWIHWRVLQPRGIWFFFLPVFDLASNSCCSLNTIKTLEEVSTHTYTHTQTSQHIVLTSLDDNNKDFVSPRSLNNHTSCIDGHDTVCHVLHKESNRIWFRLD